MNLSLPLQLKLAMCSLTVRGFDDFGRPVPLSEFEIYQDKGAVFRLDNGGLSVPCGMYRYRAQVGASKVAGTVFLKRGRRILTLFGSLDSFVYGHRGAPPSVSGEITIEGLPLVGGEWLRIQSIHDPGNYWDIEIVNGRFKSAVSPYGHCAILIFREGKPTAAALAQIPHANAVRITVAGTISSPLVKVELAEAPDRQ